MSDARRNVVSIGVFDGLHLGHRAILERAIVRAKALGGRSVVLSFDPHPDVVLRKDGFRIPAPLTPLLEKHARMEALGIDHLEVLPFTRELAALSPEEFLARHVMAPWSPAAIVVGEGFALGRGRSGDVPRLREIGRAEGFEVEAVPLADLDGKPISSTRIRDALAEGRVDEAARLLGRRYTLAGTVVHGAGVGRTLGFPTANLRLHEEKLLPRDGVYAARVGIDGEPAQRPAAMSIGLRPTFGGTTRTLEAYLLDFDDSLYGRELTVELVAWQRGQERFDSTEALLQAIGDDVAETRRRLASNAESLLTSFEAAALNAILKGNDPDLEVLRRQAAQAEVIERVLTGVGFYTNVRIPAELPRTASGRAKYDRRSVGVKIDGVANGAGVMVWIGEDGSIKQLEGFTYDDRWPEEIEGYAFSNDE